MDADPRTTVATLLPSACCGDELAADKLVALVYDELRSLAGRILGEVSGPHVLQPTALVHEAYLRLIDQDRVDWKGRTHFKAVAATAIRRALIDHLRRKRPAVTIKSDPAIAGAGEDGEIDAQHLHDALTEFATIDERASQVVTLHFYGGMTQMEIAEHLGVGERTVRGDLARARVWLRRYLRGKRKDEC